MKIYDGMGTDYEPYFMFTNRKNYRSIFAILALTGLDLVLK